MGQQVRFCTTSDGVRVAYATIGEGPALVILGLWPQGFGQAAEGVGGRR